MKIELAMVGFDNKSSENICQPLHLITSSQACNQDFWEGVGPSKGGYSELTKETFKTSSYKLTCLVILR